MATDDSRPLQKFAAEIIPVNLTDELHRSYLDYAMSVIVGRALPDVRDGLKPVHRRTLYAMHVLGNYWNKPYKKSARVVGDVIGKYHPHGDTAVYDTIVRLAQDFSMRYPLVDGQGNFGSIDGDSPAAMRYTEVRMTKFTHEMLMDLDKETVNWAPNYDGSESEPTVLPTRFPNLLTNGSSGIAVGMATNIPPHNLTEVINATLALINDPEISIDQMLEYMPGPDFPTAGLICNKSEMPEIYKSGRGGIVMRARSTVEQNKKGEDDKIIVTELPYLTNKATLLQQIAHLVRDKKIKGITELRDESDKEGVRIVIQLSRGEVGDVVLNNLYHQTRLQASFSANMVVLENGRPILTNLKQILECFIRHRRDVVTRRSVFELRKAREKAHILEGQAVALANIDRVIELIKKSSTPQIAKEALMKGVWDPGQVSSMLALCKVAGSEEEMTRPDGLALQYGLRDGKYYFSEVQVQSILELRLQRLTALEQDKIVTDYKALIEEIKYLVEILSNADILLGVIREELLEIKEKFGDERRTEMNDLETGLLAEDLIAKEEVVLTFSHQGYVKRQDISQYKAQHRGGRGKTAVKVKEEDFVINLFTANTHDTLLCFSSLGKLFHLKGYQIPQASRIARGTPIVNLLQLSENERITAILPVSHFDENQYVVMATANGTIKKTALSQFEIKRSSGKIALGLKPGDYLLGVALTQGDSKIMLFGSHGKVASFHESKIRLTGRTSVGVRGIRLKEKTKLIALQCIPEEEKSNDVLIVCENGHGKRTVLSEFANRGRGGAGVIAIKTSERNGKAINAMMVNDEDDIMLITNGGTLIRINAKEVRSVGRNTQGVRLINLEKGEELVEVAKIPSSLIADADEDSDEHVDGLDSSAISTDGDAGGNDLPQEDKHDIEE